MPPFKGNDTGGIIAYSLATQADARQLAVDHCARYGKVVKFLACRPMRAATSRSPAAGCPMAPPSGRSARSTEALSSPQQSGASHMTRKLSLLGSAICLLVLAAAARRAAWICRCARPGCGK